MSRESVNIFMENVREDLESPTTSTFLTSLNFFKRSVALNVQALDSEVDSLQKLRRSAKSLESSGREYQNSSVEFSKCMDQLATVNAANVMAQDYEADISTAISTFSVIFRELAELSNGLIRSINSNLLFPLEHLIKSDFKEKTELKKHFDKSLKEYDAKFSKLEREKKIVAKEAGMTRTEISPTEFEEELRCERKSLQLELCKFYLKSNRINTKKGVELLNNLVSFYQTQECYFKDSLAKVAEFSDYVIGVISKLATIKTVQDEERKNLLTIQERIRNSPGAPELIEKESMSSDRTTVPSPRPTSSVLPATNNYSNSAATSTSAAAGPNAVKAGYLLKKSEGKMKRIWQKRRCEVRAGVLRVHHSDELKAPVKLQLATCKIKRSVDEKKCFDLVCYNRTYHFQAEKESDARSWIEFLEAAREEAQRNLILNGDAKGGSFDKSHTNDGFARSLDNAELMYGSKMHNFNGEPFLSAEESALIQKIYQMPLNNRCADCGSTDNDVTWLSTNLGGLHCIDCSGIHRDLGVHVSRIQSLSLDRVHTALLLVATSVGNDALNEVLEETLSAHEKLRPDVLSSARKNFITQKYVERKFAARNDPRSCHALVEEALDRGDVLPLLTAYMTSTDNHAAAGGLPTPLDRKSTASLSNLENKTCPELVLHRAIELDHNGSHLSLVAFLVQNGMVDLLERSSMGDTATAVAIRLDNPEALKLLLLHRDADPGQICTAEDTVTLTDLATSLDRTSCLTVIKAAENRDKKFLENVIVPATGGLGSEIQRILDETGFETSDDERLETLSNVSYPDGGQQLPGARISDSSPPVGPTMESHFGSTGRLRSSFRKLHEKALSTGHQTIGTYHGRRSTDPPLQHQFASLRQSLNPSSTQPIKHSFQSHPNARKYFDDVSSKNNGVPPVNQRNKLQSAASASSVTTPLTNRVQRASGEGPTPEAKPHPYRKSLSAGYPSVAPSPREQNGSVEHGHRRESENGQPPPVARPRPAKYPGAQLVLPAFVASPGAPKDGSEFVARVSTTTAPQSMKPTSRQSSSTVAPPPVPPKPKPMPAPRTRVSKRCRALFDCNADYEDELSFKIGDIIVITREFVENEEQGKWMEGMVEANQSKRGIFPVCFVKFLDSE